MSEKKILLVEDNPDITKLNRMALELAGYRVLEADTLTKGREFVEQENPDLIVLDIILPDGNGLEYCRELRGESDVRVLFLSALNTKEDTLAGLRAGGDDYIAKPYIIEELLLRVETLLRRGPLTATGEAPLRFGGFMIELSARRAYLDGKDLLLTPKEFTLLEFLIQRRGQYVSAKELYEKVWGMEAVDTRPIKLHVHNIREKLGDDAPVTIESEQGKGYRIYT